MILLHKTKTFTYWRARFMPEPFGKTIQWLLNSAFDNTKVQDRLWPPYDKNNQANYFNFVNHKSTRRGYFCANFFGYEKGKIDQVIKEAFDNDQIDPTALSAPKAADGTDQQFLDGKLYFVCFENHLVLVQDMHIKARHLERYLNEMFRNRCKSFPGNQELLLERSIPRKIRKEIKGVKRIKLSAPLCYGTAGSDLERQETTTIPLGHAWDSIKAFVEDKIDLTQFNTKGFVDPKDINVTLSLSWKRKRGERISDQVDSLANTFRHVDDEINIELETHSGNFKHNELRLNHSESVIYVDDMPDKNDIFEKMIKWHEYLVRVEDI